MGSSDDLSRLNDSIQILSLRERKLNELLSTVENTVNEKNIDLSSSLESADVLKENLVIIEKENSNLREEMSSLKKTLKRLQNTQNNDT